MKKPPSGFTLVELLIVLCIIGILAGLVSSAIIKINRTAAEKRNKSNADRLQAAIVEYWHDMGRWPVAKGIKPTLKNSGDKWNDGGAAFSYAITYRGDGTAGDQGDNSLVVGELLDTLLPDRQTRKTFLDLHGFYCPAVGSGSVKWPATDLVDAFDAYNGNATDENGQAITGGKAPILAYRTGFIRCPECGAFYSPDDSNQKFYNPDDGGPRAGNGCCYFDGDGDGVPDCSYYKQNERCYRFTKAQVSDNNLVKAALPYTIRIDLVNNVVSVEQGSFRIK